MKSKVASFAVDHTTLERGFYLRSVYTVAGIYPLRSYDMRFRAPMEHAYLTPEAIHTIEHLMAHYLREKLGNKVVSFAPMGCKTGFYLSTMNNVTAEQIREALAGVYKSAFPLKSKDDIVGLNEVQCGNPGLFAVASTNRAMAQYMRCLYTPEQAEEAGIGSIYNCAY